MQEQSQYDKIRGQETTLYGTLKRLFDKKKLSILKLFLSHPNEEYSLTEVSSKTSTSLATTHRILKLLYEIDILNIQEIKQLKLYSLRKSEITQQLSELIGIEEKTPLDEFIERTKDLLGIDKIIKYGKEDPNKSNILLIGNIGSNVEESKEAEKIARSIKIRHNYKINHLSLTSEQYDQMTKMGLYPGKKKILYEK